MEITFVLVEPAREENVGAAARAIKTMGFSRLTLVNPCDYLGERALATAHASNEILQQAKVFSSLQEALEGFDLVIASSAKHRNVNEDYHLVGDLPAILSAKVDSVESVAVVFGREVSGLTNDELALCHILTTIPMRSKYPSLNLGQAVMVYAYELSKVNFSYARKKRGAVADSELVVARERLSTILEDVGIKPNTKVFCKILERFSLLNADDLNLFHRFSQKYFSKKKW
ncbi:MAG TPA: tRNA/rRNA methyltransferase [Williamwhitmania sp.]|nr:tRNA/rRNA methyltransferase [Williamwhitmania sp.]